MKDFVVEQKRPLCVMHKTIAASCYNQVRLGLHRLGNPLRVDLPDHRGLEMLLEDQVWLCVDATREDLPVMAWLGFDSRDHNRALHAPVPCELRLYHFHAGLIMGSALEALEHYLADQLELAAHASH